MLAFVLKLNVIILHKIKRNPHHSARNAIGEYNNKLVEDSSLTMLLFKLDLVYFLVIINRSRKF